MKKFVVLLLSTGCANFSLRTKSGTTLVGGRATSSVTVASIERPIFRASIDQVSRAFDQALKSEGFETRALANNQLLATRLFEGSLGKAQKIFRAGRNYTTGTSERITLGFSASDRVDDNVAATEVSVTAELVEHYAMGGDTSEPSSDSQLVSRILAKGRARLEGGK